MAEPDEVLSREVAIAAKFEQNGVKLRARSRAVAALDRLLGSLLDMPAAFFEGVSRKKRMRDEIGERLRNAQARSAEQQIEGMPELGAMLIYDVLKDKARKQINAAGVALDAIDAMKALPPPDPSLEERSTTDASHDQVDDDWMNQFVRFAEDASSERLQQVWGRVLAGEIVKPKSFSRQTLRFIAELDRETAENCEFVGRFVLGDWLFKGNNWNEGQQMLISVDLQRLGLIEGVGFAGPSHNIYLNSAGVGAICGKHWCILLHGKAEAKQSIPIFLLTRLGKEVISLLNVADEPQSLREIAEYLDKSDLQSIGLAEIDQRSDSAISFKSALQPIWQPTGQPKGA